jgi:hypothetical protein
MEEERRGRERDLMLRKFGMTKDGTDDFQQLARSGIAQEFTWWGRGGNEMLREMWKLCDCDSVHVECVGNICICDSTTVLRLDNENYTCPNKNADLDNNYSLVHSLSHPLAHKTLPVQPTNLKLQPHATQTLT